MRYLRAYLLQPQIELQKTLYKDQETEIFAPLNSGLLISYPIIIAQNIIKSNPIGFKIS